MFRIRFVPVLLLAFAMSPVNPAAAGHDANPRNGLQEVGFHDMGGDGFHTDVWTWISQSGGLYAASGTWGTVAVLGGDVGRECPSETDNPANPSHSGVKIVDATDPTDPQLVARMGTVPGAQNNDVKVMRLPTNEGPMDLLVNSLEPCGVEGLLHQVPGSPAADFISEVLGTFDQDVTGFQIWNVDDPENPVRLGKYENGGLGTHNLYLYSKGGRSYVAAVYNEVDFLGVENDFIQGYLDIVEITDPSNPTLVSRWSLEDPEGQGGPPEHDETDSEGNVVVRGLCQERGVDSAFCYNHDTWISDDGNTAYLSFWDAGLVLLDVSDPANPTFIGQGQEQLQQDPGVIVHSEKPTEVLPADPEGWLNEEGNTHVAVPMTVGGRELVLVGDEDFTGGGPIGIDVNAPPSVEGFQQAVVWAGTPPVSGETADVVYVGAGCTQADYTLAGDVSGKIVLVDHRDAAAPFAPCPQPYLFGQKVNLAAANGAIGFIQLPGEAGPNTNATTGSAPIPALELFLEPGEPVRDAVVADSEVVNSGNSAPTVNLTMGRGTPIDPWGFLRVVDVTDPNPANWREVSQFRAPHVDDQVAPDPADVLTAHNPLIGPDGKVYFAWYTDGVRVLEPALARAAAPGEFHESAWFVPRPEDHPTDNEADPHGAQEDFIGFWGSQATRHPGTGDLLVFNTDLNRGMYILGTRALCPGLGEFAGNHVVGTAAPDVLVGTPGKDVICGLGGNDVIRGGGGADVLLGHGGKDRLVGGKHADQLLGGTGKDLLRGGKHGDDLRGGKGADTLRGGQGNDDLRGQKGRDTLRGGKQNDFLRGGGGKDRCNGGKGRDVERGCRRR